MLLTTNAIQSYYQFVSYTIGEFTLKATSKLINSMQIKYALKEFENKTFMDVHVLDQRQLFHGDLNFNFSTLMHHCLS